MLRQPAPSYGEWNLYEFFIPLDRIGMILRLSVFIGSAEMCEFPLLFLFQRISPVTRANKIPIETNKRSRFVTIFSGKNRSLRILETALDVSTKFRLLQLEP
jgi:hypothetical protein